MVFVLTSLHYIFQRKRENLDNLIQRLRQASSEDVMKSLLEKSEKLLQDIEHRCSNKKNVTRIDFWKFFIVDMSSCWKHLLFFLSLTAMDLEHAETVIWVQLYNNSLQFYKNHVCVSVCYCAAAKNVSLNSGRFSVIFLLSSWRNSSSTVKPSAPFSISPKHTNR